MSIFPQRLPEYGSGRHLSSHRTHGHHLAQPRSQGPFSTSRKYFLEVDRERTLGTRLHLASWCKSHRTTRHIFLPKPRWRPFLDLLRLKHVTFNFVNEGFWKNFRRNQVLSSSKKRVFENKRESYILGSTLTLKSYWVIALWLCRKTDPGFVELCDFFGFGQEKGIQN